MGFFSDILGFVLFLFSGGMGSSSRSDGGFFAPRSEGNPFRSKPIKGHEDPWDKKHSAPENPFASNGPSLFPKSGGRNMPKDPWKVKSEQAFGKGRRSSGGLGSSTRSFDSIELDVHNRITDSFYGHRGEFDTNDAILARMEDMEQFYNINNDFDATEHGYDWDEIIDAVNDGFLPEDYLENKEDYDDDISYDSDIEEDPDYESEPESMSDSHSDSFNDYNDDSYNEDSYDDEYYE